jgi:hypothetical protein
MGTSHVIDPEPHLSSHSRGILLVSTTLLLSSTTLLLTVAAIATTFLLPLYTYYVCNSSITGTTLLSLSMRQERC